ncbi:unnamed protein product, partial [Closterium sp. NIES-54]
ELRWLTYLLTDLGEPPGSPPVLYVDNKAMLALCREQRLEHRTKHIALRYFLARELQQRGQLRLAYVASEANTADVFTKALAPCSSSLCITSSFLLQFYLRETMGRRHHAALLLDGRGGRNCFPSPFHLPIIGASLLLLLILAPQNSATAGHVTRSVTFNRTAVADRINNPADAFLRAFAEKEMSFAREAETPASSQDDWASEAAREFGEEYSSVTRREDVKGNDTAFAQARGRSMRLVRGKRGCSLTTGSWVLDNNRPAYDESTCPHLKEVATTTNCLGSRYSRPDRNWMRYSWKAHECGAQPLRFDARNFLEKMRNKNILFAGDSLMWEGFFPSFLCQVHRASPARKVNYDSRFKQTTWTVDEYKVTLIHVWSPFLMDFSSDSRVLERLKVQHPALGDTAVNLFQPDPNWTLLLPHVHLVLLQSATHWPNADKWLRRFFTDRKWQLLARQPDTFEAYTGAMNAVRERLSRKPSSKGGRYVAYFLSAPPRLAGCQNTVTLSPPEQVAYLRSKNAQSKIWFRTQKQLFGRKNSRVRFLDITHPSLARADAMIGSQGKASMDCLHPCLPGLPDNWRLPVPSRRASGAFPSRHVAPESPVRPVLSCLLRPPVPSHRACCTCSPRPVRCPFAPPLVVNSSASTFYSVGGGGDEWVAGCGRRCSEAVVSEMMSSQQPPLLSLSLSNLQLWGGG